MAAEKAAVVVSYSMKDEVSGGLRQIEEKGNSMFSSLNKGLNGIFSNMKSILIGAGGLGLVFGGFEFVKKGMESFENLENSIVRVNTVLKSTKGAAGLAGEEIEKQAKELSGSIKNGRAEIMDAQGMLLSFTGIKSPIFAQTTKAVADFAQFYKTDMTSAALSIGKAMNDPLIGMTKLQKQGVTFTETQKQTIKNFMAQGKLVEAQKVILKELGTEFGGQAEAFFKAHPELAVQKAIGSFKMSVGHLVIEIRDKLIPAVLSAIDFIKSFAHWFAGGSISAEIFRTAILTVVGGLIAYNAIQTIVAVKTSLFTWWTGMSTAAIILNTLVTEGLTAGMIALNIAMAANPVGFVITLIVALIGVFVILWNKCDKFRGIIMGIWYTVKHAFGMIVNEAKFLGTVLKDIFTFNFSKLKKDFKEHAAMMKEEIKGFSKAAKDGYEAGVKSKAKIGLGLLGHSEAKSQFDDTKKDPKALFSQTDNKSVSMSTSANYKNITLNISKLVEKMEIVTENLTANPQQIKDMISRTLTEALVNFEGLEH